MGTIRTQWAGLLALFIVLTGAGAYAAFDPIGSDGDVDACFAKKSGDLDVRKGKKCGKGEKRVTWSVEGPRGPQGEAGPRGEAGTPGAQGQPGAQGLTGSKGSPAGSMQFGWVRQGDLPGPGAAIFLAPIGGSETNAGTVSASPNVPVVIRDLAVRMNSPPGLGASWEFQLQGPSAEDEISCEVVSAVATTCNTGNQTMTLPPNSSSFRLQVANQGGATPSFMSYAYRAETP